MSQRRTLILVAAVVIGALASFLVWNYVNGVRDEAYDNAERVPVYLVKADIGRGTTGLDAQSVIVKEDIPKKFKPANAISDLEDISGKVALNALVPNQVVVTDMFVDPSDPGAQASFTERLKKIADKDQAAISITVDETRGVGGLIQPGDFVNVLITEQGQVVAADGEAPPVNQVVFGQPARFLYQKVEVLAVGTSTVPEVGASAETAAEEAAAAPAVNTGLITLMLPVEATQYLASVKPDQIYLSLVARDYKPEAQPALDLNATLPGENSSVITPYGPNGSDSGE